MNFFQLTKAICTNTDIFRKLVKTNYSRALTHLLILAFLCSLFIVSIRFLPYYRKADMICTALTERFDKLNITSKGIYPEKFPDQNFQIIINKNSSIMYFPTLSEETISTFNKQSTEFTILWVPKLIAFCMKLPKKDSYLVTKLKISKFKSPLYLKTMTATELVEYTRKFRFKPLETETVDFGMLRMEITLFYVFLNFIRAILRTILVAVLFTLTSSLVYHVMNSNANNNFSLRQVLTLSIYAGFPAIIIASFFPAFNIEFMEYQTIFLVTFIIYFFIIINRLEREPTPKEE